MLNKQRPRERKIKKEEYILRVFFERVNPMIRQ